MINIRCDKLLYITFIALIVSEVIYIVMPSYSVILMFFILSTSMFILFSFYKCFNKNKIEHYDTD